LEEDARKRIAAQYSPEKKLPFARHVIDNVGSREELRLQVEAVGREL
jgi:dephospho-CoA kinase